MQLPDVYVTMFDEVFDYGWSPDDADQVQRIAYDLFSSGFQHPVAYRPTRPPHEGLTLYTETIHHGGREFCSFSDPRLRFAFMVDMEAGPPQHVQLVKVGGDIKAFRNWVMRARLSGL